MPTDRSTIPGKLFVSFWNICLDNMPEGTFTRYRVAPDDARLSIEQARQEERLLCVSEDDLLAPYHQRERKNHAALCGVLEGHFGIALSLKDFVSQDEAEDDALYSVNPLNCVRVRHHDRLLIVTCCYRLGEKDEGRPVFEIDPATVEFHMIAATSTPRHTKAVITDAPVHQANFRRARPARRR